LKPEAVSCNLLSLCVLAPVFCTPKKLAEVSREIIVASAQEIAWTPGSSRIDGHQAENITWAISSQSPADKYDLINKTSRVSPDSGRFYEPDTVLDHRERVTGFSENVLANRIAFGKIYQSELRQRVEALGYETEVVGKHGMWEMPGVPVEAFSSRSQAIREAVGEDASLKSRDVAALDTRKSKQHVDPE
ncbi:relaxase domain-containing protein, partial [Escherichia coli]